MYYHSKVVEGKCQVAQDKYSNPEREGVALFVPAKNLFTGDTSTITVNNTI